MDLRVSDADRARLRELARRVAEIGHDPVQSERAELWRRHNALQRVRPMVLIFPEGSWRELLPESELTCSSEFARNYERDLRMRIYYAEHLPADNVIEPVVASPIVMHDSGWGITGRTTRPAEPTGAYHIDTVIEDESDVDSIRIPEVTVDWEDTRRRHEAAQELFGGILTVERVGQANYGLAPLDHYAALRGIDRMFADLVDNPSMVHKAVGRIVDGHIAMVRSMERQGALSLGNRSHYVGSGGVGYTSELPQPDFDGEHVRARDLWGFATAQIFSEVSPAMHEEFALRHEKRALELFGLNCYGCCEPLHHKLERIIRHVPRLRRVSISPWADVAKSAEALGDRYIFSWKPNPAVLAGEGWDPEGARRQIRTFCQHTQGCVVEIIMKDTHTCRNEPRRMWDWVRIAREVAEAY